MTTFQSIQVDTGSGRSTVSKMREKLNQARQIVGQLKESMETLNSTWDGPANEAMNSRFAADYETLQDYCNLLEKIVDQMEQAQTCYENGESRVDSAIQSFQLL